jgi:hypothetical protein
MMAAVPSAMGLGPGAETRGPMADAIIGGLILSTVLSLYVVPAFYVLSDRIKNRVFHRKPAAAKLANLAPNAPSAPGAPNPPPAPVTPAPTEPPPPPPGDPGTPGGTGSP